jgi:hypothetical protein
MATFCTVNSTSSYSNNFFIPLEKRQYCEDLFAFKNILVYPLCHVMLALFIILFIITISGQIKEDYRWIILNSIVLNISLGCYIEIHTLFFAQQSQLFEPNNILNLIFYLYIFSSSLMFSCSLESFFKYVFSKFLPIFFHHENFNRFYFHF